jgi:hypothetical protein
MAGQDFLVIIDYHWIAEAKPLHGVGELADLSSRVGASVAVMRFQRMNWHLLNRKIAHYVLVALPASRASAN